MAARQVIYNASPTLTKFHLSDAFVRGIRGPVGSGKSTGMCWEIMSRAQRQAHSPKKKRLTRFAVVRNTYRELADTTAKTWLDWFGDETVGRFNSQDMTHYVTCGDLEMEVMFRALDRPDDVKKVLSLELTGAWVNEAREVPKAVIDALCDRVGRYPAIKDGGCTWRGVMLDTNSPDTDHWWYRLAEEERPDNWEFFTQPGGLVEQGGKWAVNPEAENLGNLEGAEDKPPRLGRYYETRWPGKRRDHILVYYANQYGFVQEGKPVYPEYVDAVHCSGMLLEPIKGVTIEIGIDFGLTPAAVLGQRSIRGQMRWIDEVVTENMGAVRFAEVLASHLKANYAGYDFKFTGDPAGDDRAQTDETTPFMVLQSKGIMAFPATTNDPTVRREAVAVPLTRMIDGMPGLIISPKCKVTRKGMAGGYAYRRMQIAGDERYHDKPDKNKYSHPCEAGQYLMLGAGEGEKVLGLDATWSKPIKYGKPVNIA